MLLVVLRVLLGGLGAVMVAIALVIFASGADVAWTGAYPLLIGLVAIAAALFERSRYWPGRWGAAGSDMRPTDERFIDPTTGERTRVWIDSETGERSYRPDSDRAP
jgi:hypothetical protein